MFFLLFGFWVLLNGSWTLEIALIGLVVSAALYAFIVKFMGYSPKRNGRLCAVCRASSGTFCIW